MVYFRMPKLLSKKKKRKERKGKERKEIIYKVKTLGVCERYSRESNFLVIWYVNSHPLIYTSQLEY